MRRLITTIALAGGLAVAAAAATASSAAADQLGSCPTGGAGAGWTLIWSPAVAQAIGQDQEPQVVFVGDGVLVVFTDASGVGLADEGEFALQSHGRTQRTQRCSAFSSFTKASTPEKDLNGSIASVRFPANAITYQQHGPVPVQ